MVGIFITCYNRSGYLKHCLESVKRAKYPKDTIIILIDDYSTDRNVKKLINNFITTNDGLIKEYIYNTENMGIAYNIMLGYETLFHNNCDIAINIDSDSIVSADYVSVLTTLKNKFPDRIVGGFNSENRHKNGQLRNPILSKHDTYNIKKHCNGINMCMNRSDYENKVKPILSKRGNWDLNTVEKKGFPIAKPSVIEHIGVVSTMAHFDGDRSVDFKDEGIDVNSLFSIPAAPVIFHPEKTYQEIVARRKRV